MISLSARDSNNKRYIPNESHTATSIHLYIYPRQAAGGGEIISPKKAEEDKIHNDLLCQILFITPVIINMVRTVRVPPNHPGWWSGGIGGTIKKKAKMNACVRSTLVRVWDMCAQNRRGGVCWEDVNSSTFGYDTFQKCYAQWDLPDYCCVQVDYCLLYTSPSPRD